MKFGFGTGAGIISTSHDWGYQAQLTPAVVTAIPRGKVTGGSSAVNAQIYLRGLPEDFEGWASLGNDEWGWDRVLPVFRALEDDQDYHATSNGAGGPIPVRRSPRSAWLSDQLAFYEACVGVGFGESGDLLNPASSGVGALPINTLERIRYSTAIAYLGLARGRPNLTIQADSTAHRVLFDGTRARGVEVRVAGELRQLEAGEVILCAGAISSPHLLLVSGIGGAGQLGPLGVAVVCDLPGVGQNLRDHPAAPIVLEALRECPLEITQHFHQVGLRYTAANSQLRNDMIVYAASLPGTRHIVVRPTVNLALSQGELRIRPDGPASAGVPPLQRTL